MKTSTKFGILWLSWMFAGGLLALFFKWIVFQGCGYTFKGVDFSVTCFMCYLVTFVLGAILTGILADED